MQISRIRGATRVLGKSQGYLGLPLRDEPYWDKALDREVHSMVTAWTPTPLELALLNSGSNVYVRILSAQHPPMLVFVEPVEE